MDTNVGADGVKNIKVWGGLGGNFGKSGFGMVSFGTFAGGAGAYLTGGNFWQGAATGFAVSFMNDWLHEGANQKELKKRFIKGPDGKYIVNPNHKPDFSEKGVWKLHEGVRGLQEAHDAGGRPTVTNFELTTDIGLTSDDGTKISINSSAIKNNLTFASILFHEYRHAFQITAPYTIGGTTYASRVTFWTEIHGVGEYILQQDKTIGGFRAAMEYDAYSYQWRIGDHSTYVNERGTEYWRQIRYKY